MSSGRPQRVERQGVQASDSSPAGRPWPLKSFQRLHPPCGTTLPI